jgi:arabinose-5-phosphate isomerase
MSKTQSWTETGREVLNTEIEGLAAVRDRLDAAFDKAVNLLAACAGRVIVTGLGKSGLVGRKIAATLSSTGTPSFFLHPVEGAHGDLGAIRQEDVIMAISYSGRTAELNAILPAMRSLASSLIVITGDLESPMARTADLVLDISVPREACPLDLAPTTSTTAALVMGDALAVCLTHSKAFSPDDFRRFHPGGALGQRLRLKSADIMHTANLPVADLGTTIRDALAALDKGGLGAVLLTEDDRLKGILTDGDVRRLLARGTLDLSAPVAAVMTRDPRHGDSRQSGAELLDIMEHAAITVLPVTDGENRLVGVVHLHDLLGKGQVHFSS